MKNEKMIRQKRLEAQFMQLLNESFADLDDPMFAGISVTHVVLSKGKYDARVFVRCDDETQKTEYFLERFSTRRAVMARPPPPLPASDWPAPSGR